MVKKLIIWYKDSIWIIMIKIDDSISKKLRKVYSELCKVINRG